MEFFRETAALVLNKFMVMCNHVSTFTGIVKSAATSNIFISRYRLSYDVARMSKCKYCTRKVREMHRFL